jgi:hypothetical protein
MSWIPQFCCHLFLRTWVSKIGHLVPRNCAIQQSRAVPNTRHAPDLRPKIFSPALWRGVSRVSKWIRSLLVLCGLPPLPAYSILASANFQISIHNMTPILPLSKLEIIKKRWTGVNHRWSRKWSRPNSVNVPCEGL